MEQDAALQQERMDREFAMKQQQAERDAELAIYKIEKEAEVRNRANLLNAAMQPQGEEGESKAQEKAEAKNKPRKVTIKAPSGQTYTGTIE